MELIETVVQALKKPRKNLSQMWLQTRMSRMLLLMLLWQVYKVKTKQNIKKAKENHSEISLYFFVNKFLIIYKICRVNFTWLYITSTVGIKCEDNSFT